MLLLSALFMASYVVQHRKDFTQDFNNVVNGNGIVSTGLTLGDGITQPKTYWVHYGPINLSSTRLELNNADVKIIGNIIFNQNDASIDQMLENERIIKKFETDTIFIE